MTMLYPFSRFAQVNKQIFGQVTKLTDAYLHVRIRTVPKMCVCDASHDANYYQHD